MAVPQAEEGCVKLSSRGRQELLASGYNSRAQVCNMFMAEMELDGLQSDDLPIDTGSGEVFVSGENIVTDDYHGESPPRKRKLYTEENSGGDENREGTSDRHFPALKMLEKHPPADSTNGPQSALTASQFGEISGLDENNVDIVNLQHPAVEELHVCRDPFPHLRASDVEENPTRDENSYLLTAFRTSLIKEITSGDANTENFSSDPHRSALNSLHAEENPAGEDVNEAISGSDPLPDFSPLDGLESLRASVQAGDSLAEDSQPTSRRRKLILMSAVAAAFSSLAGALASIGELFVQLQGVSMSGTPSISARSESNTLSHYAALLARSSSVLDNNNLLVFVFLLMQHRRRTLKRPRELTGPWYIKPRSVQGFESFLDFSPQVDPEKFKELFRISPNLFYYICEMVSNEMLSDTPRSLRVLPNRVLAVERQVAIALRRLATGNQFLGIADSFGVSKSTAVKVTWKFILAFIKKAGHLHLQWPHREQMQEVKDGFKNDWGFPNCCGVLDGTHFTVEFPKGEDVSSYYDHQNHVSISMQAIVGHDLRFLDVVVGWPGSVQDYQLLQNTNFFRSVVEAKDRLNGEAFITQDGTPLREYVIGDEGYPLYDWLIVPYPSGLSAAKDEWNSRHAAARSCVETALGRLKGTWRILSRILWKPRKERIGKMVFACCLLHNMIIERQDGLNPEVYAGINPHPGGYSGVSNPTMDVFEGGPRARDVLFREVLGGGIV